MSLPHILLGLLAEPASGYDLKQYFSQSIAHFWSAELSQIYPALSKLEKQGYLSSQTQPSEKGPPRKIYARTKEGKAHLREWLLEGPQARTERLSFLTQVFFLDAIPIQRRLAFMQELKADFETHLEELKAVDQYWRDEDPRYPDELPDDAFYKQMTLQLGIMKYATIIEWCEQCIQRMEKRRELS